MDVGIQSEYRGVVDQICALKWSALNPAELTAVAWAYYFFSIQFRENLEIACELYPADPKLAQLRREECATDNLSPWPGVAVAGEKMNHDEFMRRTLTLSTFDEGHRAYIEALGRAYLGEMRDMSPAARAFSIASYEDGGLEAVFNAILRAPAWGGDLLGAFRHFLVEHIRFDSDPDQGHGSLSRHLVHDDRIVSAWRAFRDMLIGAAPALSA